MRGPRLTIPTRILLAISALLVAFGIMAGTSLVQHQRSAATLRLLHEAYVPLALRLGELAAAQSVVSNMLEYVLDERDGARTRQWIASRRQIVPGRLHETLALVERAGRLDLSEGDQRIVEDVRRSMQDVEAGFGDMDSAFPALFDAIERGDRARAEQIHGQIVSRDGQLRRLLLVAGNRVKNRIEATSRAAADQERAAVMMVAVLAALALVAGLGVTFWAQRLLAPLPRLRERVVAVARGDLSTRFEGGRDDEIGVLAEEFEKMVHAVGTRDRQLRELQQTQEQIVVSLRAAVLVVDAEGVLRTTNNAAQSVLSISASAVGGPLSATRVLERLEGLEDAIEAVAAGGPRASLTAAALRMQGHRESRHVDVLVTPFGAGARGDNDRRAVLVVADDVTDELRTKQRLIQSERLAVMGKMAAHVTHEVRNPLSSIGLNVELLAEELPSGEGEAHALLRSIQREIDRLTGITEEYLRLARLPAPRLEAEDLGALVSEVARFVARELEAGASTLKLDVDEGLPLVLADEAQIRQSLLNLLRNAGEAMPGGGVVEIAVRHADEGVSIDVRDHGEGIPEEQRTRIFDLFYSTKERGTGLGLPLTQQIVVAHRGRIRCDDAPGGGTIFSLWFPPAAQGAEEEEAEEEGSDAPNSAGASRADAPDSAGATRLDSPKSASASTGGAVEAERVETS